MLFVQMFNWWIEKFITIIYNEWNNEQIYLKLPQFTYITHGPFVSIQERIRKFKETRHPRYIYQMS